MQPLLAELGRIRLGTSKPTGRTSRSGQEIRQPLKLETFRFTSQSRPAIEMAAAKHGGEVHEWMNQGHREWDVITDADELWVSVPNTPGAIDTNYEWWAGGECLHRCDSRFDRKTGKPCACPADPAERHALSKMNPQQACGLKTRLHLVVPDLFDLGTWRLETGSFYAAGHLLSKVQFMEAMRDRAGLLIPARLWLAHDSDVKNGQTRRWITPAIELQGTLRQYANGELAAGGIAAQLPPAPGQPLAITAAPATPTAVPAGPPPPPDPDPSVTAQDLADDLIGAATRQQVHRISQQVKDAGMADDKVFGPPAGDPDAAHVEMILSELALSHWAALPEGT